MTVKAFIPFKSYTLFVSLMLFTIVILLLWVALTRTNDFYAYHQSTARDTVTGMAVEAAQFVAEKKRMVNLFGQEKIELITRFVKDPDNEQHYKELEEKINTYFPNYFTFTVADANGTTYIEDFNGFVGEYCKDDIKQFSKTNTYRPKIHPNSEAYHFDIMSSFGENENKGILFISFHADILTGLLSSSQALGHDLMLTYPKLQSLIEVTADGARNHWDRHDYRLAAHEKERIMFQMPVPGTVWNATDLHKPTLFSEYKNKIAIQSFIIFMVFTAIGMFTIIVVKKEEKRREKSEQALVIAKNQADIANKAKSDFLANMSHELRTPLNAIIGYSEILKDEAADSGFKRFTPDLQKISHAGAHLLALINEILDLSKIEADRMELQLENFNIDQFIDNVLTTVQPLIEINNNQLTLQRSEILGEIHSDPTKLRQILFNLISNSCKFTENGLITVNLLREINDESDSIIIIVKDTGIGMTSEQIDMIFQPFVQVDTSTTRKYGGTGLGLAITQRYCAMLGGQISVTSEPDKGTEFIARIKSNLVVSAAEESGNTTTVVDITKIQKQAPANSENNDLSGKYKTK